MTAHPCPVHGPGRVHLDGPCGCFRGGEAPEWAALDEPTWGVHDPRTGHTTPAMSEQHAREAAVFPMRVVQMSYPDQVRTVDWRSGAIGLGSVLGLRVIESPFLRRGRAMIHDGVAIVGTGERSQLELAQDIYDQLLADTFDASLLSGCGFGPLPSPHGGGERAHPGPQRRAAADERAG